MIKLESIKTKERKRKGRGISAGQGKTAGRGTKGQKSRAGHNIPKRFEGGQTPLSMRLPKLPGFKAKRRNRPVVVTLDQISKLYKDGEIVSIETLVAKNLITKNDRVKILNNGKLSVKVILEDVSASKNIISLFASKPKVDAASAEGGAGAPASEGMRGVTKKPEKKTAVKSAAKKTTK